MPARYQNDLLIRAARGERTERTPVWLMRQAGRTDPEYLRLRDEVGLPLEDLFRHPELAARISLLPQRLGVDAIIFYQDILTPLSPMGGHFVFAPGPKLTEPIERVEDLDRLETYDIPKHLPFVRETLDNIHANLAGALPVLGFAGAPLTLAVFLIEGGSFSGSAPKSLHWLHENPRAIHLLLERLTAMTIAYLQYQAEAGVAAVQLFESAAFLLDRGLYREFALPYQQAVFRALRPYVKTINFAREWNHVEDLAEAGADIVSLPSSIGIADARAQLGDEQVLQGNLDNRMIVNASREEVVAATEDCIRQGAHHGHIFNLSHGLLKETPFEIVQLVVETARNTRVL